MPFFNEPGQFYNRTPPEVILTKFVPEVSAWARDITLSSPIQQDFMKVPARLNNTLWKVPGSVLDLLLNYNFESLEYSIYYRQLNKNRISDRVVVCRSDVYAGTLRFYGNDSTSVTTIQSYPIDSTNAGLEVNIITDIEIDPEENDVPSDSMFDSMDLTLYNIFNITYGEKDLLDMLFYHKQGFTVDISGIDYHALPSTLSKLIYIYLDFELNNSLEFMCSTTPVTIDYNTELPEGCANNLKIGVDPPNPSLLSWIFEKWLVDHVFRVLTFNGAVRFDDCGSLEEALNARQQITLDPNNIQTRSLFFPEDMIPSSEEDIFVTFNGQQQKLKTDYDYVVDASDPDNVIAYLTWQGLGLQSKVEVGDNLYLLWSYRST